MVCSLFNTSAHCLYDYVYCVQWNTHNNDDNMIYMVCASNRWSSNAPSSKWRRPSGDRPIIQSNLMLHRIP